MFQKQIIKHQNKPIKRKEDQENHQPKVKLPATLFNRSPLKISNNSALASSRKVDNNLKQRALGTPLRKHYQSGFSESQGIQYNYQSTPSLFQTKMLNTIQHSSSLLGSNQSLVCENIAHKNKKATFYVVSDGQQVPYCQKCAILLASQGFTVTKICQNYFDSQHSDNQSFIINPLRQRQILKFMNQLQQTLCKSKQKQSQISYTVSLNKQYISNCQQTINSYFNSIQQIIEKQRQAVIQQFRQTTSVFQIPTLNRIQAQCQAIKNDISQSIKKINDSQDSVYQLIMNTYWNKLQQFNTLIDLTKIQRVSQRKVEVGDIKQAQIQLLNIIDVHFQQINNEFNQNKKSIYFSFDKQLEEEKEIQQPSNESHVDTGNILSSL